MLTQSSYARVYFELTGSRVYESCFDQRLSSHFIPSAYALS